MPQDVTLPNSINSANFWHIFDSGSKFEILKPNSSCLTFGISKFVSLSISHFFISFSSTFFLHCAVRYQHFGYYISKLLPFWLLHLKLTTFGYYISKLLSFWLLHLKITTILLLHLKLTTFSYDISKLLSFQLLHLKITIILAITSQNFILLYQTQHRYQLPHQTL